MLDGYFYFGFIGIDTLGSFVHFDLADISQKLKMHQDEQTFVELESALILFFNDGHGDDVVSDSNRYQFVVSFHHLSHYLSESFIIKDNLSSASIIKFIETIKFRHKDQFLPNVTFLLVEVWKINYFSNSSTKITLTVSSFISESFVAFLEDGLPSSRYTATYVGSPNWRTSVIWHFFNVLS